MLAHPLLIPILSIAGGICVLIFPTILNYIVAIYLIVIGIVGLFAMR